MTRSDGAERCRHRARHISVLAAQRGAPSPGVFGHGAKEREVHDEGEERCSTGHGREIDVLSAEPAVTAAPTAESTLRLLTGEGVFDAVVLVDGIGRAEIERALPAIEAELAPVLGEASTTSAVYDLAYALTAEEV